MYILDLNLGVTRSRLGSSRYQSRAEDAWSASIKIQAHTNANDKTLAEANAIVNPIFAGETVSVG